MENDTINNLIMVELKGLRQYLDLKFQNNDDAHKAINDHLVILNGQVVKNSAFRLQMGAVINFLAWAIGGGFVIGFLVYLFR